MQTFENQKEESLTTEARNPARVWGSAVSSPTGVWGKAQPIFIMVQFELHRWPLVIDFLKDLCMKIPCFYGSKECNGKTEFHKFRAEWRKDGGNAE